jgi:hypothetical protein
MSESFEYRLDPSQMQPYDESRMIVTGTLHITGKGSGATVAEPFVHLLTRKDGLMWRLEFLSGAEEVDKLAGSTGEPTTS